jgi:hypothetical protein
MTKYPTLMIDHLVEVGVEARAGVAQYPLPADHLLHFPPNPIPAPYPQYHQPRPRHPATHAHALVHNIDLAPGPAHAHAPEDGMNQIHGLTPNTKPTSALKKKHTRKGWRFAVEWRKSVTIPNHRDKSQCDHGVRITKSYYLHHHLRISVWTRIRRIM